MSTSSRVCLKKQLYQKPKFTFVKWGIIYGPQVWKYLHEIKQPITSCFLRMAEKYVIWTSDFLFSYNIYLFFSFKKSLFILRESERASMSRGGAERQGDRESQAGSTLRVEPNTKRGLIPWLRDHDLGQNQESISGLTESHLGGPTSISLIL